MRILRGLVLMGSGMLVLVYLQSLHSRLALVRQSLSRIPAGAHKAGHQRHDSGPGINDEVSRRALSNRANPGMLRTRFRGRFPAGRITIL